MKNLTSLIDLDAMTFVIAAGQWKAGNRDQPKEVKDHAHRFVSHICKSSTIKDYILMYQAAGHNNFRKAILPEYKGHRATPDFITHWKPTIVEAYSEMDALGLTSIETDDAQSVLAAKIGYDNVVIVSSDKDMIQVPTLHYNPYKRSTAAKQVKPEDRWFNSDMFFANRFFWMQVLAGDPTDMPNELCGIQGVGMGKDKVSGTACKILDKPEYDDLKFEQIIQAEYSKRYGAKEGFLRASRTYKMVRLLTLERNGYATKEALAEVDLITSIYPKYVQKIQSATDQLFNAPKPKVDLTHLFTKDD